MLPSDVQTTNQKRKLRPSKHMRTSCSCPSPQHRIALIDPEIAVSSTRKSVVNPGRAATACDARTSVTSAQYRWSNRWGSQCNLHRTSCMCPACCCMHADLCAVTLTPSKRTLACTCSAASALCAAHSSSLPGWPCTCSGCKSCTPAAA